MKVHIHEWVLNGKWKCIAPDHVHPEPDILDANTAWHVLGVIKTHSITSFWNNENTPLLDLQCECGWLGQDYMEHLDDAVFYWLRDIDGKV